MIKFKKREDYRNKALNYSFFQLMSLLILRISIGWHFLYEGVVKLMNPGWSSSGYLLESKGWFAGIFYSIASNAQALKITDFLNVWGLTAIGLGLILGFLTRVSAIFGMILLLFYYASHPSFIGFEYALPSEGNYLIVNKTLIELFALWVLFQFSGSERIGLDRFIYRNKN